MVVKKWRAITIKNSKMKDHLLCYSNKEGSVGVLADWAAFEEARTWIEKPECIRIIIEKEEFKNEK